MAARDGQRMQKDAVHSSQDLEPCHRLWSLDRCYRGSELQAAFNAIRATQLAQKDSLSPGDREASVNEPAAFQSRAFVKPASSSSGRRERCSRIGQVPTYWSTGLQAAGSHVPGWQVQIVTPEERAALQNCLVTTSSFGSRVNQGVCTYSKLELEHAWRLENPALWGKYQFALESIRSDISVIERTWGKPEDLFVRKQLFEATRNLPGRTSPDVNEVYLLHGTRAGSLLSILQNGMNERYSGSSAGSAFGEGSYLSDDPAKCNQYVQVDAILAEESELHRRLFTACNVTHAGNLYYMFLSRCAMGFFASTRDGKTHSGHAGVLGKGMSIFALGGKNRRELEDIPCTVPPISYHGLVVQNGPGHERFTEYVQFHGDRCYPEYLIAFKRKMPDPLSANLDAEYAQTVLHRAFCWVQWDRHSRQAKTGRSPWFPIRPEVPRRT